ncbi:MAG: hydrolase [Nocardioidaceae bacterium]|nr:hydrolase [Nocardioidaceae bacterium]
MSESRLIPTPYGDGRLVTHRASSPFVTLVLSHGAGGGIEARDLVALSKALPKQGVNVALFEQPWRHAGKRVANAPGTLDVGLRAAVDKMRVRTPLIVGGRSAGARSALRTGRDLGASGILALSFPLHPPGRPEKSRLEELEAARLPTLVIQGGKDPMGRPEEFPDPLPRRTQLVVVPHAEHGFGTTKAGPMSETEAMAIVVESTLAWLVRE